jgi:hypothetical protein
MSDTKILTRPYVIGPVDTSFVVPAGAGIVQQLFLDTQVVGSITVASGFVSQWNDQSGFGRNVVQSNNSNQWGYGAGVGGGAPTLNGFYVMDLSFGSGTAYMDCIAATWGATVNQRYAVFGVFLTTGGAASTLTYPVAGNGGALLSSDGASHVGYAAGAGQYGSTNTYLNVWTILAGDFNHPGSASTLYAYTHTGGLHTETTADPGGGSISDFRIGATNPAGGYLLGNIAEIRVYTGMGTTDVTNMISTIAARWGL